MNKLLALIFAAITAFFGIGQVPAQDNSQIAQASPSPTVEISTITTTQYQFKPSVTSYPYMTATPTKIAILPTKKTDVPAITPLPTIQIASFTPIITSGTFRPGAGNCNPNPTGSYTFEINNYNEKDTITGVKIKVSVKGLTPNARYILNVGSKTSLGGPSINTDGEGSADYDFNNGAYTVNYKEIYSISIDHPDKLYPENSCLLDDLVEGQG